MCFASSHGEFCWSSMRTKMRQLEWGNFVFTTVPPQSLPEFHESFCVIFLLNSNDHPSWMYNSNSSQKTELLPRYYCRQRTTLIFVIFILQYVILDELLQYVRASCDRFPQGSITIHGLCIGRVAFPILTGPGTQSEFLLKSHFWRPTCGQWITNIGPLVMAL